VIEATLVRVLSEDRGRCLAALIARFRDFDLAEEALSDAVEAALRHWQRGGVPVAPRAWLLAVARRKAIDLLRRAQRFREREAEIEMLAEAAADPVEEADIPDERLRLIFTCCHPALDPKSRVALTLRTLGGLTTAEIARAFLDREPAMGQRLSRAKAKIRDAGIPFAVPGAELWGDRLGSVLDVLYLIFNEGYSRTRGDAPLRVDLCEEAIWLGRMVDTLCPDEAEVLGLLALMLSVHARRPARFGAGGAMIALDRQDRRLWNPALTAEARAHLDRAVGLGAPGPFQIKAAISILHLGAVSADATDWPQIILLYDALLRHEPTPVVRLNRAAALAGAGALAEAEQELAALGGELGQYQPYHAACADILARLGRAPEAAAAYHRAINLAGTEAERAFLRMRRDAGAHRG
jgi:RNA polymerase sigma-70 factor, ECF subfamily